MTAPWAAYRTAVHMSCCLYHTAVQMNGCMCNVPCHSASVLTLSPLCSLTLMSGLPVLAHAPHWYAILLPVPRVATLDPNPPNP